MKIIAANFKMTHTRAGTKVYLESVSRYMQEKKITNRAMVFPPYTALDPYSYANITVGAQNGYAKENGSFTGEIGLEQMKEFGITTILLGHSERRHIMGESQEKIAEKFAFYAAQGFEICYCIGEPLEVKEQGFEAVMRYNETQYVGIDLSYSKLIVAYEPVWAIGTGKTATNEDIAAIHTELRKKIKCPILYGGSVKPGNIGEILKLPNVDGALIGTASWKEEDFCAMLSA